MTFQPYTRSADVYDVIYQMVDYPGDAATIVAAIRSHRPEAASLLEIGCGTGAYLAEFAEHFDVLGIDVSLEMLEVSRAQHPHLEVVEADMRAMDLGRRFDAVVCLFSSIGYMTTRDELEEALQRMYAHLEPGGVMVIDPWFDPETYEPGHISADVFRGDGIIVSRSTYGDAEDGVSVLEMDHVVVQANIGRAHFVEQHRMGLFTELEYRDILESLGLVVERTEPPWQGRYRLVCCDQRSGDES